MTYDVIVVGGGLAGSTIARTMAEAGARTLVIEREKSFRDRVRGEGMHPWGVAEARALGIYDLLRESCGHEVRWWNSYDDDLEVTPRDLVETSPHQAGSLNFYHPEMQEVLLQAALASGAEVHRGATVKNVTSGKLPTVEVQIDGQSTVLTSRLVIGADGRTSRVRSWGGFQVNRDPDSQMIASTLLRSLSLGEDGVHVKYDPTGKQLVIIFPVGSRRFRIYYIYRANGGRRNLSGRQKMGEFITACIASGTPPSWYAEASSIGPLAEYSGAPRWINHPYQDGVALIGDAAGATDPSWGCGLSLALRDVRVLSQEMLCNDNWDQAANAYAAKREQYFGDLHRIEGWYATLMYESGVEADERRERAFGKERQNIPDIVGLGPDSPSDESARRRFFGEE